MLPIGVDTWGPGAGHEGRGWVWPGGLRTRPWFALALRPPAAGLGAAAGPPSCQYEAPTTTPKYGHLLPTRRPRATMAA